MIELEITIQESNNTYIINYFYDDNKLITEIKDNIRNDYIYDELYGFIQNNTNIYYYVRDYIGNILGIVDNSGDLIVKYDYDAYGNTISITGENIYNPFIYKGYYYDNDIEMYYCHNRFYNPKWRRWLTPDSPNYLNIDTPSGMNLFIYCNNNPVMYEDGDGNLPQWANWLIGGAFIVGAIALTIATAGLGGALATAMGGGLMASIGGGAIAGASIGAVSGALISVGTQTIKNGFENINCIEVLKSAGLGALSGLVAGGIFGGIKYYASASKLSTSISKIGEAQANIDNAFAPLNSVSDFANMPFAGNNIANAIGMAASNYNSAYANFIIASLDKTISYFAISGAYAASQFGLKQGVTYLISLVW